MPPELKNRPKVKKRSELLKKELKLFAFRLLLLKLRSKDLMMRRDNLPSKSNKRKLKLKQH
jgi:hypothetical protein